MNKATLDIAIISVAFLTGAFLSFDHNPLLGVSLLVFILAAWVYVPKTFSILSKSHVTEKESISLEEPVALKIPVFAETSAKTHLEK